MSISFQVLGMPDRDNALLVLIDSGQSVSRLMFDCGDGCFNDLTYGDIQSIDHLFISHFHMDHVGGFDSFFRCNYKRATKPNHIWGPPDTATICQHRFQGFKWNLHWSMVGRWFVHDVHPNRVQTTRYELTEAFENAYDEGSVECGPMFLDERTYTVSAFAMDHMIPSLAFLVEEKPKTNVDISKLGSLGLKPGPWIKDLKDLNSDVTAVEFDGVSHSFADLRAQLLTETPGESICYLTDFLLDDEVITELAPKLKGCKNMVCEAQYRHADLELAQKNRHMTVKYSATLAKQADVEDLILFHLSDRYEASERVDMLAEAREIFSNARFPKQWGIEGDAG